MELLILEASSGQLLRLLAKMFEIITGKKLTAADPALEFIDLRVIFERINLSATIDFAIGSELHAQITFIQNISKQSNDLHVTAMVGYDTLMLMALVLSDFIKPEELEVWESREDFAEALRRHYVASSPKKQSLTI